MISIACTHLSSVKFVGTSKYWYSTVPDAGIVNSSVMVTTASGVPIDHAAGYSGLGGSLLRSPGFAPASSHRRIV